MVNNHEISLSKLEYYGITDVPHIKNKTYNILVHRKVVCILYNTGIYKYIYINIYIYIYIYIIIIVIIIINSTIKASVV